MVLPLSAAVLDVLLVTNFLFGVLLLVSALSVRDPVKFTVLPSVLLMATLWRLSLNLATTRAVLSNGYAGRAVEAFGSIVIQGSVIVGVVLFLLVSLVQFVVVAKGAERVAEVAARFTLDAMPGKQMSIEAELRNGLITPEDARTKRSDIQTESRFYGALDGAMKFVKGDAVAGLIIAGVNIIGGLTLGILVHGLDLATAIRKYSILTIGDGLLSQIPSLLNAVAAGLVVTRVKMQEASTLSSDLVAQFGQFTAARACVGITALLFGCLPGAPHLAAILIGGSLLVTTLVGSKSNGHPSQRGFVPFEPTLSPLLQIDLHPDLIPHLPPLSELLKELEGIRGEIFNTWGLVVERPGVAVWHERRGAYRISVRGIEVYEHPGELADVDWCAVRKDILKIVSINRIELADDSVTRRCVDYVDRQAPDLVAGVIPGVLSLTQLTSLMRDLLRENISVRNLDIILQTVAYHGARLTERSLLAEIRVALKQLVSFSVADGNVIHAITIEPLLDLVLSKAEENHSVVSVEVADLVAHCIAEIRDREVVAVASKRSRAYLRDILIAHGLTVPVIAYEEVAVGYRLENIESISVSDPTHRVQLMEQLGT